MRVEKVINNNIVSSFDEKNREVIVMGKGIGFKVKPGSLIEEERIEKIFRMASDTESEKFKKLLKEMPLEHLQVSNEIIQYAKKVVNRKLNRSIYITLTDHIDFVLQRMKEGIYLKNVLLWEIKRFYPQEFKIGMKAIEIIHEHLGVALPEDEAAAIALHFIGAQLNAGMSNTLDMTKIIQNALSIIRYYYQMDLKEDSLHYERFITHLKFFSQRILLGNRIEEEDMILKDIIKKYKKAYACAEKIKEYIKKVYYIEITEAEMLYLTVHIQRVTTL